MRECLNIAERVIMMIRAPWHFWVTAAAIGLFGVLYIMGQAAPRDPSNIAPKQRAAASGSTKDFVCPF
jgi:hypothetical protein